MINLNCFNWNNILPKQYLWESTCGFHAIRNAIHMYNILISINNYSNRENYQKNIYQNINFNNLVSENELNNEIKKYQRLISTKGDINSEQILRILNKFYNKYPIKVIYSLNDNNFKLRNFELKVMIVYRERYNVSKHWIPIIIHKLNNDINLHIIDSFGSTWYGEDLINQIVEKIKIDNNFDFKINCKNQNYSNLFVMTFSKFFDIILLVFFIFFVTHGTFNN